MIQVSRYSSINFDNDWKLRFQIQADYCQKFATTDKPRVQYVLSADSLLKPFIEVNGVVTQQESLTLNQTDDFIVKEVVLNLASIQPGAEVLLFFAENDSSVHELESLFLVTDETDDTVLIEYTNRRNEFDTIFSTNSLFQFRVEGAFLPQDYTFESQSENFRDQRHVAKTLSGYPIEKKTLSLGGGFGVPRWVASLINNIFSLSNVYVNGDRMVRDEGGSVEMTLLHNDYPLYIYKITLEKSDDITADLVALFRAVDSKKKVARSSGEDIRVYNEFAKSLGISDSKMIRELSTIEEISKNFYIEIDDGSSSNTGKATLALLQKFIFEGWINQPVRTSDDVKFRSVVSSNYKEKNNGWSIDATGISEFADLFLRGVFEVMGDSVFHGDIKSHDYATGALGAGYGLVKDSNGDSLLEVDRLLVRKIAYFVELVIQRMSHVGGQIVLTPASMKCIRVEEFDDYYRCYFESTDGDKTLTNDFVVGDQARCQTFNIKTGTSQNVSNSYYWRLVVGVGDDYIDLSKADCDAGSTVPQADDEIVLLGNRTDATRQAAIVLAAYGEDAPYIKLYRGIDSYQLSGKEFISFSRTQIKMIADELYFSTGESVSTVINGVKADLAETKTEFQGKIDTVDSKVDGIQIGVRNLLLKSNVELDYNAYNIGYYKFSERPVVGKQYTFVMCYTLGADNSYIAVYQDGGYAGIGKSFSTRGEKVVESYTFTYSSTRGDSGMYFYQMPKGTYGGSKVHWAILVEGNKAPTQWIAAPEDIQQQITDAVDDLSDTLDLVNALSDDLEAVKNQADGAIETWFYDPVPTLNNAPANQWTDEATKKVHLGDLYYSGEGKTYRFQLIDGAYGWKAIADTDITLALQKAEKAQDTADGKRRVFVTQPTNASAYDVGDLWVNATYGNYSNELLRCKTAKAANAAWSINHWEKASKYTDDTAANQAIADAATAQSAANAAQEAANQAAEAAADAAQEAAAAQQDATEAKTELNQINSDSVISPVEKTALKQQQADIQAEYNEIIADAGRYGISTTAYKNAYTSANNALTKYTATSPTYITVGSDYANIAAYYDARQTILNSIAAAAKQASDDAMQAAEDEAELAKWRAIGYSWNSGKPLWTDDPTFKKGINGLSVYDNAHSGSVSITREAKQSDSPVNDSGYNLKIACSGGGSPNNGGFLRGFMTRANAVFVFRFIAKLPVGAAFDFNYNSYGAEGTYRWVTPNGGTGRFEEYIAVAKCGATGSFSTIGYFSIWGTVPVTCYLAYAGAFDVTAGVSTGEQLQTVSGTVVQLDGDFQATKKELNIWKEQIETDFTALEGTTKEQVENAVLNLQKGMRNLVRQGKYDISSSTAYLVKDVQLTKDLVEGNKYTIVIKATLRGDQNLGVYEYDAMVRQVTFNKSDFVNGAFARSFTYNAYSDSTRRDVLRLYNRPSSGSAANPMDLEWVCLYEGDITDTAPDYFVNAPEDLNLEINSVKQSVSAIEQTADRISARVTTTETKVTTAQNTADAAQAAADAADAKADNAQSSADSALDAANDALNASNSGKLYVKGTGYNVGGAAVNPPRQVILNNNGVNIAIPTTRGMNLITLNRSDLSVGYNLNYDYTTSQINSLIERLNSLTDNVIVILTSKDSFGTAGDTLPNLLEATSRCGGSGNAAAFDSRVPYALVGIPGIGKGAGIEMFTSSLNTAPAAEISTQIINGIPVGISTQAKNMLEEAKDYTDGRTKPMWKGWIDATGLDEDKYYPVTIDIPSRRKSTIEVYQSLNYNCKPSWSTHNGGFSLKCIWEVIGSGWGINPTLGRQVLDYSKGFTAEETVTIDDESVTRAVHPVGTISQIGQANMEYIYVRGGGKYYFTVTNANESTVPALRTSDYTWTSGSSSVTLKVLTSAEIKVIEITGVTKTELTAEIEILDDRIKQTVTKTDYDANNVALNNQIGQLETSYNSINGTVSSLNTRLGVLEESGFIVQDDFVTLFSQQLSESGAEIASYLNLTPDKVTLGTDMLEFNADKVKFVSENGLIKLFDGTNVINVNNGKFLVKNTGELNINNGVFKVTNTGAMTATNANITGTVTATILKATQGGQIGGFEISGTVLRTTNKQIVGGNTYYYGLTLTSQLMRYLDDDDNVVFIGAHPDETVGGKRKLGTFMLDGGDYTSMSSGDSVALICAAPTTATITGKSVALWVNGVSVLRGIDLINRLGTKTGTVTVTPNDSVMCISGDVTLSADSNLKYLCDDGFVHLLLIINTSNSKRYVRGLRNGNSATILGYWSKLFCYTQGYWYGPSDEY